jgi:DNA-directed RNA polymerase subunit M/transcription elongation factor TFIIS
MVKLIKLNINGEINEINININKNEKYNLESIKTELNITSNKFKIQHEWDIENNKTIRLLGCLEGNKDDENFHQLPIKNKYQFFGDLYTIMVSNNIIQDLDLENFENIYNALYFDSDEEESEESSIEEDVEDSYSDIEEQVSEDEEELVSLDNYGDDNSSDEESVIDVEEKKKSKALKKKKLIKITETQDILHEETIPPEKFEFDIREKMLTILLGIDKNQEIDKEYFKQLEMEIFNYSIKDSIKRNIVPTWNIILRKIYINKARSLYINILPGSYVNNKRLFNRMKNKEFTPKELVNMTTQELFPENWKHLIDEKDRRNKVLYETKKEAMTDQFKCRKCKSRETCYYEMQTRSADEPMTIFITCLNCGTRWKN